MNNWPLRQKKKSKPPPNVRTPVVAVDLDPEDFPEQLSLFVEDVTTFLTCLNEFPEFADEVVNASILVFQGDLRVCMGRVDPTLCLLPEPV
jgi:WD repeat-containing protein 26